METSERKKGKTMDREYESNMDIKHECKPEVNKELIRLKAKCQTTIRNMIRETVSWTGLSKLTYNRLMCDLGELWEKYPEKELDVDWIFSNVTNEKLKQVNKQLVEALEWIDERIISVKRRGPVPAALAANKEVSDGNGR